MIEESSNVEQLLVIGPETACQSSSMPSMPAICPAPRIPGTERQGEGADQVVSVPPCSASAPPELRFRCAASLSNSECRSVRADLRALPTPFIGLQENE